MSPINWRRSEIHIINFISVHSCTRINLSTTFNSLTLHTMLQWLSTLHLHHFDVIQTDLPINAETGQGHAYNLIQKLKREEQEVILNQMYINTRNNHVIHNVNCTIYNHILPTRPQIVTICQPGNVFYTTNPKECASSVPRLSKIFLRLYPFKCNI